jgi:glycosyltransferase involved in cell wall biosynthesis
MPREVIDKVGMLDETFRNGIEDFDYCKRIRKAGYKVFNTYDSFVYHFFMRTPRPEPLSEVDRHNKMVVGLKYDKPLFVIHTGLAWERWNGASLENEGLGGSETAAIYIAQEFSRKGYRAIVFGDCQGKEIVHQGVEYLDYHRFDEFSNSTYMDIFVSARRPELFSVRIRASYKICFATDTWFRTDDIHMDKVDRFFVISPPHKDLLVERYKIPPEKMFVSRCGVDLSRFDQVVPREKAKFIYTSAPNRGLEILLWLFPKVRARFPEATLHIFYGFNYLEAAATRGDMALAACIDRIKKSMDQPGVIFHGRVSLAELTKELLSSSLWAYPTDFHENFCISAVEAMAAGVPVIASDYAAMPSTVGDAGVLIQGDPRTVAYQERFLEECLRLLGDAERWGDYSKRGRARARLFPWSTIADEWLEVIRKDLEKKGLKLG